MSRFSAHHPKMQVDIITADSDRRFVSELRNAIEQGWVPAWESFRVTVVNEPRTKVIHNILLQKTD